MDNIVSRQIPHNEEAEKAVLGGIFIDPNALVEAQGIVDVDDFYTRANKVMFQAMLSLDKKNMAIDAITIQAELERNNLLQDAGGVAYISELALSTPTSAHVAYYAQLVKRASMLRNLIATSQNIIQTAIQGSEDVTDILDDAETAILNVANQQNSGNFRNIQELVNNAVKEINDLSMQKDEVTGIETGFVDLDRMTTGFHEDELIILAARPGVGKTSFALNIANHVGKSDQSVAVFSLEMSGEQLVQRMLASEGMIDSKHLRTGKLEGDEWDKLLMAADSLSSSNIYIDDTPGIKMSEIRAKSLRLAKEQVEHPLGMVIIDYLQLIEGPRSESRQQEVSAISRQLKKLAKELHVPVIALSQLSRSVEQRQDKRPVLSDLRESGSIEQDADIVGFLYRDDYYREETDDPQAGVREDPDDGQVEVIIEKNRSGSRGTVELMFSKPYSRFTNLDRQHQEM